MLLKPAKIMTLGLDVPKCVKDQAQADAVSGVGPQRHSIWQETKMVLHPGKWMP